MAPGDPQPAYQDAEVFVLPSLEDGFGYVVAEAMASGLPVVVTDQCGAAEWVTPERNGWIVPTRSPEAIANALRHALAQRGDLDEMGRAARSAVVERMSRRPEEVYAQWLRRLFDGVG
jgi:glycosyltransferase involved in cell wall biosynthesis